MRRKSIAFQYLVLALHQELPAFLRGAGYLSKKRMPGCWANDSKSACHILIRAQGAVDNVSILATKILLTVLLSSPLCRESACLCSCSPPPLSLSCSLFLSLCLSISLPIFLSLCLFLYVSIPLWENNKWVNIINNVVY